MTTYRQRGFSLIEMLMVLAILSIVMAVTMSAIMDVQKRQRTEEAKVDLNQESREFVEQIVRDLHGSGYPTLAMYQTAITVNNASVAAGLVDAQTTSIWFEGDMDHNGNVESVKYQLISDPANAVANRCPCILQRAQIPKVDGVAPAAQVFVAADFATQVDGIINSGGGAAAKVIDGSFRATDNVTVINNDTYYAPYKIDPIFRYFDSGGNELTPPIADLTTVRSVRINVNTMSRVFDPITRAYPVNQQKSAARISNR